MNVFLCSLNLNVSSTLPGIPAPFHELSCPLHCTSLSIPPDAAGAMLFLKKSIVHGTVLLSVLTLAHLYGYLSLSLNAVHSIFPVLNYMVQTVYVFVLISVVWMGGFVYEWPVGGQLRCLGSSSFVPFFLTSKANLMPLQWITTYTESCFPHKRVLKGQEPQKARESSYGFTSTK